MKTADRVSSGIIIAICVYFQIRTKNFNPLSRLFPQVIIIVLGGLALLLFVMSFVKPSEKRVLESRDKYIIPMLSAALMLGWVAFIRLTGFLISSVIFFPLMVVVLTKEKSNKMRILRNCLISLALIAVFFLLFSLVLNVQFPSGLIGLI